MFSKEENMSNDISRREFLKRGAKSGAALAALSSFSSLPAFSQSLPTVDWQGPVPMAERISGAEWIPPKGYEKVAEMIDKPLRVYNSGSMEQDPATGINQEEFYKKTGIEVVPIEVPSPSMMPKITTTLASRSQTPVLTQVPNEMYLGFVEPGWVEPCCELWDEETHKHFSSAWKNEYTTDIDASRDVNCVYGTFSINQIYCTNWRADVLEEYGLDAANYREPTWDDIMEIGEALEGSGRYVFVQHARIARYAREPLFYFIFSQGGSIWEDGNLVLNSDVAVAALEFLVELVEKEYIPNPDTTGQGDLASLFLSGQAVGAFQATKLMASAYEELDPEAYAMGLGFKANRGPNPVHATLERGATLQINTWSPDIRKLAGKIYADFRRSRESQVREFVHEGNFPGIIDAFQDEKMKQSKFSAHFDTLNALVEHPTYVGIFPRMTDLADTMKREVGAAYTGEKTAREALDALQSTIDMVLGQ